MRTTIAALVMMMTASSAIADSHSYTVDIWVDNWFELWVNGEDVLEDSVPITTERSFNAETASFNADLPITIAVMAKDFRENDTGLEYIGTRRQQMGDGGMIAQIRDADTGETVAVTDNSMRCLVVHRAPLDTSCVQESNPIAGQEPCAYETVDMPEDWTLPEFDDSEWPMAVEHSAAAVSPKGGYDRVKWDSGAKLVWSDNLVQDNTLLCRMTLE